jgi:hypothetical protein
MRREFLPFRPSVTLRLLKRKNRLWTGTLVDGKKSAAVRAMAVLRFSASLGGSHTRSRGNGTATFALLGCVPTDHEATRERFANCRQPHGNREGPIFLSVSVGRRGSLRQLRDATSWPRYPLSTKARAIAQPVSISGQKRGVFGIIKRELRRRSAIEAVIGHMKGDGHLGRCYLKGREGDAANAILTAVGHNLRLVLTWLRILLRLILDALLRAFSSQTVLSVDS